MATHSRILAWEIPWTDEPGKLQFWGCKESDTTQELNGNSVNINWETNTKVDPKIGHQGEKTIQLDRPNVSSGTKQQESLICQFEEMRVALNR